MAKVIFLHLSVFLFMGGLPQCMLGYHTPWEQTPPGTDTPWEQTLGADTPLGADTTPPRQADSGIQSMSGRYVSYWNAFLLALKCGRDEKNFRHEYLVISQCGRYIEFHKN